MFLERGQEAQPIAHILFCNGCCRDIDTEPYARPLHKSKAKHLFSSRCNHIMCMTMCFGEATGSWSVDVRIQCAKSNCTHCSLSWDIHSAPNAEPLNDVDHPKNSGSRGHHPAMTDLTIQLLSLSPKSQNTERSLLSCCWWRLIQQMIMPVCCSLQSWTIHRLMRLTMMMPICWKTLGFCCMAFCCLVWSRPRWNPLNVCLLERTQYTPLRKRIHVCWDD